MIPRPRAGGGARGSRSAEAPLLLEAVGLGKRFGAIEALRDVSLALRPSEVVALVGENGAGKSTLIKILAGVFPADAGSLRLDGEPLELASPAEAWRRGIAVIHQDLQLCDNLSIAANVFLGRAPLRWRALGWIDRRGMEAAARRALVRVGLDRDPRAPVATLGPAARQLVEIARAAAMEARVVVMDEPTSSLGREESERLLALVDDLRRGGVAVLYVSHRLEEVVRVADRAVVLRDGRVEGELERGEIDGGALVRLMIGRDLGGGGRAGGDSAAGRTAHETRIPPHDGAPLLAVRDLRVAPESPAVSFELYPGEILGLFGLVGAGRSELLETLFGLRRAAAGTIEVAGAGAGWSVSAAVAAGLALVPEDRRAQALVAEMTVAENLALGDLGRRHLLARRNRREERRRAVALCRELDVRPAAPETVVGRLSGGNQQKVALGKWLALGPRVLLLDEPTRGVDVGARAEIHRRLGALADGGVGIVLSSAETAEVLGLADRVLVLVRGASAGILAGVERREETLLRLAAGGAAPGRAFTPGGRA
ncbi:MAG TPA: sugar ABC transporter ATP-binding protein [Thermoanaerobaculia bacterium]|nr:sugar ABC transporter ATP-binding protein [Thermoanaerobaculia bacterium]